MMVTAAKRMSTRRWWRETALLLIPASRPSLIVIAKCSFVVLTALSLPPPEPPDQSPLRPPLTQVRSSADHIQFDLSHRLGFLSNPKRFNVAVTRAKKLLVVVGNPRVLGRDAHWGELLRMAVRAGAYRGCQLPAGLGAGAEGVGALDKRFAPSLFELRCSSLVLVSRRAPIRCPLLPAGSADVRTDTAETSGCKARSIAFVGSLSFSVEFTRASCVSAQQEVAEVALRLPVTILPAKGSRPSYLRSSPGASQ